MRVRVSDVLDLLANGLSPEEIVAEMPDLELKDIRASLRFAGRRLDHPVVTEKGLWPSYTLPMNAEYTAVLKQDGDWWIGWIEEVPGVNCQEHTKADLLTSLREVLAEAIEFNRREALDAAGEQFEEERIAL
jgi:predicted RNase H-like HicB family nuclease